MSNVIEFQSPRSGKCVSNDKVERSLNFIPAKFQSPRSGKFVSNLRERIRQHLKVLHSFQSPRSGKFVSNSPKNDCKLTMSFKRTTFCRHYITNGKMFENVAKKIFQIRTLLLIDSLR